MLLCFMVCFALYALALQGKYYMYAHASVSWQQTVKQTKHTLDSDV